MEIQNIFKILFLFSLIFFQQHFHFLSDFFRKCGSHPAYFIRHFFIISDSKPVFSGITGSTLQCQMKFFDQFFSQRRFCIVYHHINTPKMIRRFDHIIHIQHFIFYTDRVCFKNISGLIVRQTTALNMIGVVCQINLCFMINSSGILTCFLFLKNLQQRNRLYFLFIRTLRLFCIFGNIPGFPCKECTVHAPLRTVISHTPF